MFRAVKYFLPAKAVENDQDYGAGFQRERGFVG
jgi:hypothetical protein